jgi:septal ring factor EnvC (AmiA/AmiB activator)
VDKQQFDEMIAGLQTWWKEKVQYGDLFDKNRRAIFSLAETNEQLAQVKRELATAKAGLTEAMQDNERRHVEALKELQAKLTWTQKEIGKAEAKLEEVEKKTAQAGAQYDAYVRGMTALKRQLEVA